MCANPHHPWRSAIGADFTILKEEIDTSLRPTHLAVAPGQLTLPAIHLLKSSQKVVEPVETCLVSVHSRCSRACL